MTKKPKKILQTLLAMGKKAAQELNRPLIKRGFARFLPNVGNIPQMAKAGASKLEDLTKKEVDILGDMLIEMKKENQGLGAFH